MSSLNEEHSVIYIYNRFDEINNIYNNNTIRLNYYNIVVKKMIIDNKVKKLEELYSKLNKF